MSLEDVIEDSLEKALAKGGKKAIIKGIEALIHEGIIEEVTKRVISVAVAELSEIIEVAVVLAIVKIIMESTITESDKKLVELKKGIINSVSNQFDNKKVQELIREYFENIPKGDVNKV